jgi:hypothetical protein
MEFSKKAGSKTNDSDHSSMMNLCGEQTHVRQFW